MVESQLVQLKPVGGLHSYVVPPDATSVVLNPMNMVASGLATIVGKGLMVILKVLVPPPLHNIVSAVTLYVIVYVPAGVVAKSITPVLSFILTLEFDEYTPPFVKPATVSGTGFSAVIHIGVV